MLGDGQTAYDQDNDGDANSIGSCQVRIPRLSGRRCLTNLNGRPGDGPAHERDHQAQAHIRQGRVSRRKSRPRPSQAHGQTHAALGQSPL
jgi:hypothetical protein